MTDEQIIKAFEDCLNDRCEDCLNAGKCFYIENSIWGLAKRQQAEIDKLHQTNFNLIKGIGDLVELTRAEAIKEFADEFDNILAEMRDEYHKRDLISYGLVCETVHARLAMLTKKKVGADNE